MPYWDFNKPRGNKFNEQEIGESREIRKLHCTFAIPHFCLLNNLFVDANT